MVDRGRLELPGRDACEAVAWPSFELPTRDRPAGGVLGRGRTDSSRVTAERSAVELRPPRRGLPFAVAVFGFQGAGESWKQKEKGLALARPFGFAVLALRCRPRRANPKGLAVRCGEVDGRSTLTTRLKRACFDRRHFCRFRIPRAGLKPTHDLATLADPWQCGQVAICHRDDVPEPLSILEARAKHSFHEPEWAGDPAGWNPTRPWPRRRIVLRGPPTGRRDRAQTGGDGPAREGESEERPEAGQLGSSAARCPDSPDEAASCRSRLPDSPDYPGRKGARASNLSWKIIRTLL